MMWAEDAIMSVLSDVPKPTIDFVKAVYPNVKTIRNDHRSRTHEFLSKMEKRGVVDSILIDTPALRKRKFWFKAGAEIRYDGIMSTFVDDVLSCIADEWKSSSEIYFELYGTKPNKSGRDRITRLLKKQKNIERRLEKPNRYEWRAVT